MERPLKILDGVIMIEYDENGEEWFGYTFSSEQTDPTTVIEVFRGNVQYAEWFVRQISNKSKQLPLAAKLQYLFDLLPGEAVGAITDDQPALIREIIRARNRYAHGKFEEAAPSTTRLHTLSVKVAALISFAERVHEGHPNDAIAMAQGGSPYIRSQLGQTDVPY
jgi:hypothetical protein